MGRGKSGTGARAGRTNTGRVSVAAALGIAPGSQFYYGESPVQVKSMGSAGGETFILERFSGPGKLSGEPFEVSAAELQAKIKQGDQFVGSALFTKPGSYNGVQKIRVEALQASAADYAIPSDVLELRKREGGDGWSLVLPGRGGYYAINGPSTPRTPDVTLVANAPLRPLKAFVSDLVQAAGSAQRIQELRLPEGATSYPAWVTEVIARHRDAIRKGK